jgi:signal transduction histidine kinase
MGNPPTLREEGGEALALAGITHDARNLVTALGLCAELLSQPGVLAPTHGHFSGESRSIAESSGQLVKRLSEFCRKTAQTKESLVAEAAVADLSESVQKMQSLLSAIAGPVAEVQFACLPCGGHLRLTEESLSRILVNLVRNAADAMPTGRRSAAGGRAFCGRWTETGRSRARSTCGTIRRTEPGPARGQCS